MAVRTFAAIDIGSFEITLKIYEIGGRGRMKAVDCLVRSIALGSDTYAEGKIGNDKVEELCEVLSDFKSVMKAYKVKDYRAYGTSAIRETKNHTILLDKIEQRTGIRISVLSNSEQRFLDYKSVAWTGDDFKKAIEQSAAILDIGGGSIQISLFDKDTLVSTQNLRLGVLRIQDRLSHVDRDLSHAGEVVDEMVSAQLATYKKLYLGSETVRNLIIVDDYISPWAASRTKSGESVTITPKDLRNLLKELESQSSYKIAKKLGVSEERLPLLVISSLLTLRIAEMMNTSVVWIPGVTLCDGIAYEYAEEEGLLKGEHDFERDIIACAKGISKRYMGSRTRSETLSKIAGTIFNSMKKIHGLGSREKLYLELAAILHACGKYISLVNIGERSYDIIMASEIIGLSHAEREIVANIVRFNHSDFIYFDEIREQSIGQGGVSSLDRNAYLTIAKLTAILRVANSLDRSHKKKMFDIKAKLDGNELILSTETPENITLEKAFFEESAEFFEEVYSIRPVLRQEV